jgi:hypothetical protein
MSTDADVILDDAPEHIPALPYDVQREREKEQIRKIAEELRKKSGNIEPIIVNSDGIAKKASQLTLSEKEYEFIRCATNPIYFIETYLTIFDQTKGSGGEIVPFILFDFQKDLVETYLNNRFVVANKYRQAGISTTTCAFIAWYVMFKQNRSVAIVADKLETARDELMNDVVLFIEGCPEWLRPLTGRDTNEKFKDTQKLKRYDNGSSLGAFSSKGLRGYSGMKRLGLKREISSGHRLNQHFKRVVQQSWYQHLLVLMQYSTKHLMVLVEVRITSKQLNYGGTMTQDITKVWFG